MSDERRELGPFPTDELTLDLLEGALETCLDGNNEPVGGSGITLSRLLDFLSGSPEGLSVDDPLFDAKECPVSYSERDVIRALIEELQKERARVALLLEEVVSTEREAAEHNEEHGLGLIPALECSYLRTLLTAELVRMDDDDEEDDDEGH